MAKQSLRLRTAHILFFMDKNMRGPQKIELLRIFWGEEEPSEKARKFQRNFEQKTCAPTKYFDNCIN